LWAFIVGAQLTSSELVLTEVPRGLQRITVTNRLADPLASLVIAEVLLEDLTLYPIARAGLRRAGRHFEPNLGSLDAIHLIAALELRPVEVFVTYDERQAAAARKAGLPIISPGMKK
jgi:predicted nucleic acid-binding protein